MVVCMPYYKVQDQNILFKIEELSNFILVDEVDDILAKCKRIDTCWLQYVIFLTSKKFAAIFLRCIMIYISHSFTLLWKLKILLYVYYAPTHHNTFLNLKNIFKPFKSTFHGLILYFDYKINLATNLFNRNPNSEKLILLFKFDFNFRVKKF